MSVRVNVGSLFPLKKKTKKPLLDLSNVSVVTEKDILLKNAGTGELSTDGIVSYNDEYYTVILEGWNAGIRHDPVTLYKACEWWRETTEYNDEEVNNELSI